MKELLSLLLAALLLVAIVPFAGAAFSDEGSIDKSFKTSVVKMSDKGVISGFSDGSFGPAKTLTRAQAAKILCVMLEGSEKAEALTKTETGFSDVPETHWSAKYVAYCVEKGVVAGVGDGKFNPDGELSAAAFAKMLLVAYGADASKFTGADWMKAVEEAAPGALLDNRVKDFTDRALPRQEAAQMAYSAMFCAEALAAKNDKDVSRELPASLPESIKILAIGNSFSNDSILGYLPQMLKGAGVKSFKIGNLYHGGCSLQMHVEYALAEQKAYQLYTRTEKDTKWKQSKKNARTLDDALKEDAWDYITFQHGQSLFGVESAFHPALDVLMYYVQRTQPQAAFGWNFVWAAPDGSTRAAVKKYYGGDQMKMYDMSVAATKNQVLTEPRTKFVMPVGTAIQNARTSFLGDHLDRDGYHLNKGIGRYIASLTWCCKLTGVDPDKITYLPETLVQDKKDYKIEGLDMSAPGLLEALGKVARESVKNALAKPFEITQSQYTTAP